MPIPPNVDDASVYRLPGLTASADGSFVSAIDVSHYAWLNLQIGDSAYSGVLTFYGSCDPAALSNPSDPSWTPVSMYRTENLHGADSASSTDGGYNIMASRPITFSYFQVLMSGYASGAAIGTLELRREGMPGFSLISVAASLIDAQNSRIGLISNHGLASKEIAAGETADTVINSDNAFLSHVLIANAGTNEMHFYDNGSAGSGKLIGIIPANAITSTIIKPKAYCDNGITAKGDANNPAITVFYINI